MTCRELVDWQRFEAFHQPLPDRLADLHSALLCSIVVNLVRAAGTERARVSDFFVLRDDREPPDDGLSEVDRARLAWRGG